VEALVPAQGLLDSPLTIIVPNQAKSAGTILVIGLMVQQARSALERSTDLVEEALASNPDREDAYHMTMERCSPRPTRRKWGLPVRRRKRSAGR
jgi:hypothetical protein